MPRLLLITFCYPPTEVIGAVRPAALAKYLPCFGWNPLILTPQLKTSRIDSEIIETGYQDVVANWKTRIGLNMEQGVHEQLRLPVSSKPRSGLFHTRAIDLVKYLLSYPDETKGWIPFALKAIDQIRDQYQIDAILTTSPPISTHLIGCEAKKLMGCPWIADLRDLWTQNLSTSHPILDSLQLGLEKRTLRVADALVTVSTPWTKRLQRRYTSHTVCTITNGFDPDHFSPLSKQVTSKFTITYAGLLYQGHRDPQLLFQVLRDLFDEALMHPEDIQVRFYGPVEPWLTTLIERYQLEKVVGVHGVISRQEALQRQAESQVLLLLGWTDPRETGQHSGKLFEYLGAARPILAIGGSHSVLTETLNETQAGIHAFSEEQVRQFLVTAYREFKSKGYVPYYGVEAARERYTHFQMAGQFADVLSLVSRKSKVANRAASPVF